MTPEALVPLPPEPVMRIIESEIGSVIPAIDIADNIGYRRSSITNIINSHRDLFKDFILKKSLPTPGGNQDFLCLNHIGMERLIFHLRPIKTRPELCERIEAFKAKAFGQLAEQKQEKPDIRTELIQAKIYAETVGIDVRAFQAAVFKKHGMPEFADIVRPPIECGEPGWYNPEHLVPLCNDRYLNAERLNHFLMNKGFQYKDGRLWRLTPAGEAHGKEYRFESYTGHGEIRIRWRKSVLVAAGLIREEGQAALPEKIE